MKILKNQDMVVGVFFILFSLFILHEISLFQQPDEKVRAIGPTFFPNVLSYSTLVLSIMLTAKSFFSPSGPVFPAQFFSKKSLFSAGSVLAGVLIFITAVDMLGFLAWSAIFLFVLQWILGEKRLKINILISIGFPLILYLLFSVGLGVILPSCALFK